MAADRLPDPADERFPTVICPFCGSDVDTYQHPAGGVLMCEHRKPNKQWSCEGGGRAPANPGPVSAAVSPAAPRCEVHTFATTDKCGCDGPPVAAAVSPAEPLPDGFVRDILCAIVYQAERLVQDGLNANATAIRIRDKALLALGADHDETLRILRGDYGR